MAPTMPSLLRGGGSVLAWCTLALACNWIAAASGAGVSPRLSGRHDLDYQRLPVVLSLKRSDFLPVGQSVSPSPIPAGQTIIGGDWIDGGDQNGPTDPAINWAILSDYAQQYLLEAAGTGMGFQAAPQQMYVAGDIVLDVDLTSLYPITPRTQGMCNSCWAVAAAEHFQAVLIRQGYLSGPWLSTEVPTPKPIFPDQVSHEMDEEGGGAHGNGTDRVMIHCVFFFGALVSSRFIADVPSYLRPDGNRLLEHERLRRWLHRPRLAVDGQQLRRRADGELPAGER